MIDCFWNSTVLKVGLRCGYTNTQVHERADCPQPSILEVDPNASSSNRIKMLPPGLPTPNNGQVLRTCPFGPLASRFVWAHLGLLLFILFVNQLNLVKPAQCNPYHSVQTFPLTRRLKYLLQDGHFLLVHPQHFTYTQTKCWWPKYQT